MRNLFILCATLFGLACNDSDFPSRDWPPDGADDDTGVDDDSSTSDDDSGNDDDSGDDTDDDDTAPDECAEAMTLCGMELDDQIALRGIGWGVDITTQSASSGYDWADPIDVAEGIAVGGLYPPVPDFPDVSYYPDAYNEATDYLNDWYGWNWCCSVLNWAAEYHNPVYITVHHTAGRFDDVLDYTEYVYNFHTFGQDRGWGDIGYQRLVGRDADDGEIHHIEGRWSGDASPDRDPWGSLWVVGAHVGGSNTDNAGVSVIGTYTDAPPDTETLAAVKAHVARTAYEIGLTETSLILGHRDWGSTECPGEQLYALLPEIREHVDWCQNTCGLTSMARMAAPVPGPFVTQSSHEFEGDNH